MFGQANISSRGADFVFSLDREINLNINFLSITSDQNCLNYLLHIGCMTAYSPCPGTAWCGSNSEDDLRSAVASACMCNNPDSCIVNGLNVSRVIDNLVVNYYQGRSTGGSVGVNNATCQDVTVGKRPKRI